MADTEKPKIVTLPVLAYFFEKLEGRYVVKETGKGLSTNDFTNELKTKLDNVESCDCEVATNEDIDALLNEAFGEETQEAGAGSDEAEGGGANLDDP